MTNLDKRLTKIEEKIIPILKVLTVLVKEEDATCEVAKQRVLQEHGLTEVPKGCVLFVLNIFGKPQI